uniref:Uncharacterized protein n=1 Tax=Tetranychus urticae TaxID=32264 RepID=T1KR31_TETUR
MVPLFVHLFFITVIFFELLVGIWWIIYCTKNSPTIKNSVQLTTITTPIYVQKTPNEDFDEYPEVPSKFANSKKEIKSLLTRSSDSTDKIVNYVSSTTTQNTDSSTPTTEKPEIMKRSSHSSSSKGS